MLIAADWTHRRNAFNPKSIMVRLLATAFRRNDASIQPKAFMVRLVFITAATALTLLAASFSNSQAQQPTKLTITPDPTFGNGGFQADHVDMKSRSSDQGRFLTLDKQGRAVVAGNSTGQKFAIARYLSDGRPDVSFGSAGKTAICIENEATVKAAAKTEVQFTFGGAIDSQDRLILVGKGAGDDGRKSDMAVLRFTPDGQLDKSFAENGYRKYEAHDDDNVALAVAAGDKNSLLVAGYANVGRGMVDPLLIRFLENGRLDEEFTANANGSLRWLVKEGTPASAASMAIDSQGRILVGLNIEKDNRATWAVARLKPSGAIDQTFGNRGLWTGSVDPEAIDEVSFSIALDEEEQIVLGGYSDDGKGNRRFAMIDLDKDGRRENFGAVLNYGTKVANRWGITYRYGPRAAVSKDYIAIGGAIEGEKPKSRYFGLAIIDKRDPKKPVATIEPQPFPTGSGMDQPWGVVFDDAGRILLGGGSQAVNNSMRFAIARYIVSTQ
jgi:uncharacterized delta-60 repeat protein